MVDRLMIEKQYDITIRDIVFADSHFGTEIYHIGIGGRKYVLKAFPQYMESAKNEGRVAEFLLDRAIKVSRFLKTVDGRFYVAAGNHILTIQEYIPGTTLQLNAAPGWFLDESARLLGRINASLTQFDGLPTRFGADFFAAGTAIEKRTQLENELLAVKANLNPRAGMRYEEQIKHLGRISQFQIDAGKLTYANSHGDYNITQAIVSGKEISIIDWASACRLPICLEVITSFIFASPECNNGAIDVVGLKRYISCYRECFPLSEYDVTAMPYVLYFWHCMCNYAPHEEIPQGYKPIATLINNMLNWLHCNVDTLAEGLCSC